MTVLSAVSFAVSAAGTLTSIDTRKVESGDTVANAPSSFRNDVVNVSRPKALIVLGSLFGLAVSTTVNSIGTSPSTAPSIHVGDGSIDGRILKPYDNAWLVTVRYKDGRRDERGVSSDHVRFRDIGGKKLLTRIEGTTSLTGDANAAPIAKFEMTVNVFDPETLRPASGIEVTSGGERIEHQFNGLQVATLLHASGQTTESHTTSTLPEPVYDFNGGMTGLLLATLPLKVGYEATLPVLGESGFDTVGVTVVREEIIPAGYHGDMKSFVVEIGRNPVESTYWISKTLPYVLRVQVNATNATASWDIIN